MDLLGYRSATFEEGVNMKNYLMISLKGLIALSVLVVAMLIALELRDQRSLQAKWNTRIDS